MSLAGIEARSSSPSAVRCLEECCHSCASVSVTHTVRGVDAHVCGMESVGHHRLIKPLRETRNKVQQKVVKFVRSVNSFCSVHLGS